jgi:hypothetical protein
MLKKEDIKYIITDTLTILFLYFVVEDVRFTVIACTYLILVKLTTISINSNNSQKSDFSEEDEDDL